MEKKQQLMLVDMTILPKVYHGVLKAKQYLSSAEAATVHEAAEMAGISRSAYYKYKDYIFPFYEMKDEQIVTLFFILTDRTGVLSEILTVLAKEQVNILTINQNLPVGGVADLTISLKTPHLSAGLQEMLDALKLVPGVKKVDMIARG